MPQSKSKQIKTFPCGMCKGRGKWVEPVLDDGTGPMEYCGYCEGNGLIEIGGEIHKKRKAERIADLTWEIKEAYTELKKHIKQSDKVRLRLEKRLVSLQEQKCKLVV